MTPMRRIERAGLRRVLWLIPVLAVLVIFPPVHVRSTRASAVAQPARISPQTFAETFWEKTLPGQESVALDAIELWRAAEDDPKSLSKLGHTSGIGARPVFLVRGTATIASVDERGIALDLGKRPAGATMLLTGPIFGNQLRDSTGLIRVEDFDSFDFNTISTELNRLVEARVQPDLRQRATIGARIAFFGAAEIDDASADHAILKIVPISVTWP